MSKTNTEQPAKKHSYKRTIIYLVITLVVCGVGLMFPSVGDSPSMKVVIDDEGTVARYISEDESSYFVGTQDTYHVLKSAAKTKTFYAAKGDGVVYMIDFGTLPVHKSASEKSKTVAELVYEYGYVPDTYKCLGYKKGWYKVKVGDTTGYVAKEYVVWDAVDSF